MDRVLLLNPPGNDRYLRDQYYSHVSKGAYTWPPCDLMALSGTLHGGSELVVIDAIAEGLGESACERRVRSAAPQVVFAVVGSVSWRQDLAFLRRLRRHDDGLRIYVSGDAFLEDPRGALERHHELDGILLDFADCGAPALVAHGGPARNAVLRRPDGGVEVHRNTDGAVSYGLPRHELFPHRRYRLPYLSRHPFASILTMTGCAYSCSHCGHARLAPRLRDMGEVGAELIRVGELGWRELWVRDRAFGSDPEHAAAFLDLLSAGHFRFGWSCETRPELLTGDLLNRMAASGCHTVGLGVEAADDGILERARKGYTLADVRRAFAGLRERGMVSVAHFCLGLPGETPETLSAVRPLVDELQPDWLSVNIATPLPNTALREEALEKGWIKPEQTMLDPSVSRPCMRLPDVSCEQLWRTRTELIKRFYLDPRRVLRRAGEIRSVDQAFTLAREGLGLFASGFGGRLQG